MIRRWVIISVLRREEVLQLCDITLTDALAIFLKPDWTQAYVKYFGLR